MMGSAIFVSSAIIHIRKRAFEKKLEDLAARKRKRRIGRAMHFSRSRTRDLAAGTQRNYATAIGAVPGHFVEENAGRWGYSATIDLKDQSIGNSSTGYMESSIHPSLNQGPITTINMSGLVPEQGREGEMFGEHQNPTDRMNERIRFGGDTCSVRTPVSSDIRERSVNNLVQPIRRGHSRIFDGSGVGVRPLENHPKNALPLVAAPSDLSHGDDIVMNYEDTFKYGDESFTAMDKYMKTHDGYIGRNSQFHNLTEKERRKLGGIEYDAIHLLSYVVPVYFVLWQLIGALGIGAYIQLNRPDLALQNGQSIDPPVHN